MESSSGGGVDVLADVLAMTRIGHTIFCRSELPTPWGMRFEPGPRVNFHVVGRGACWLHSGEHEPLQLVQGDIVLLPHGQGHALSDVPTTPILPYRQVVERAAEQALLASGAENRSTVLLCGAYHFEEQERHPLLRLLPRVVHVPADEAQGASSLQLVLRVLMREFSEQEPGSAAVVSRLVDTLFVFVVRAWLSRRSGCAAGWLGALRDPQIGRALSLIHGEPSHRWTVALIAGQVGMSRTAFAKRFGELVGETPLAYLMRWRMDVAARHLRDSEERVYSIAARVGYDSETSFSKAFRRAYGVAPGRYRVLHEPAAG